jgi:hypothetical protein
MVIHLYIERCSNSYWCWWLEQAGNCISTITILGHSLIFYNLKNYKPYRKCTAHKMCSSFLCSIVRNTFCSNKYLVSWTWDVYRKHLDLHVCVCYYCPILTKIGMCWQTVANFPSIKLHKICWALFMLLHVDRHGKADQHIFDTFHCGHARNKCCCLLSTMIISDVCPYNLLHKQRKRLTLWY